MSVEPYHDIMSAIFRAENSDPLAVAVSVKLAEWPIAAGSDMAGYDNQRRVSTCAVS